MTYQTQRHTYAQKKKKKEGKARQTRIRWMGRATHTEDSAQASWGGWLGDLLLWNTRDSLDAAAKISLAGTPEISSSRFNTCNVEADLSPHPLPLKHNHSHPASLTRNGNTLHSHSIQPKTPKPFEATGTATAQ